MGGLDPESSASRPSSPPSSSPPTVSLAAGIAPRRRFTLNWELLGCATAGHELVGTDVAAGSRGDDRLVRYSTNGQRWHRCLRCDAWLHVPVPSEPARLEFPTPEELLIPLRGRALRDRYVLRLIALERVAHVVVFVAVGVIILAVAGNRTTLNTDFQRVVANMRGGSGPAAGTGILAEIGKFLTFSYTSLYLLAAVALAYALLESVEAVGLWFGKRWAEYITFAATIVLIPYEIYDLTKRVSVLTVVTLLVNLAIALYLLDAKRLFGIRGGSNAVKAVQDADGGWDAVDRATPPSGMTRQEAEP